MSTCLEKQEVRGNNSQQRFHASSSKSKIPSWLLLDHIIPLALQRNNNAPLAKAISDDPELVFPLSLNLTYQPKISKFLIVFKKDLDISKKRLIVLDLNNTITPDFIYFPYYEVNLVNRVMEHEHIQTSKEREKFLRGIHKLGSPECIYKKHRFVLSNGYVYAADTNVLITPRKTIISEPNEVKEILSRTQFISLSDFSLQVRALAVRRGISFKEVEEITCDAYLDTVHMFPALEYPGFNSLFPLFMRRTSHAYRVIVSDNQMRIVHGLIKYLKLDNVLRDGNDAVFYRAEKRLNYESILTYLINTRHVSPEETLVIGDSYYSDIRIPLRMGIDTVHITFNRDAIPWKLYAEDGTPSIVAGTFDDAIKFLIDRQS